MIQELDSNGYFEAVLRSRRHGGETLLAFYDHRLKALVRDARLMLAPFDDHLFHRGDGVFEVIKFIDRRLYQLDEHLARLRRSAEAIGLLPPLGWEELRILVLKVCRQAASKPESMPDRQAGNQPDTSPDSQSARQVGSQPGSGDIADNGSGIVRIYLGRGPGGFGVDPAECPVSSLYIAVSRFTPKPESWYAKGLSACRAAVPARPEFFSQIKNTNYLPAVLMTMDAHARSFDVSLCFDAEGCLAESAVANICLVDAQGRLLVPEFTNALPGTTIRRAMELLQTAGERGQTGKNAASVSGAGIECLVRRIPEAELASAAEVLLLGTSPDCASIVQYEGKAIGNGQPGPAARLLRRLIVEDIDRNGICF